MICENIHGVWCNGIHIIECPFQGINNLKGRHSLFQTFYYLFHKMRTLAFAVWYLCERLENIQQFTLITFHTIVN